LGITKANLGITDTDENVKSTAVTSATTYYLTGTSASTTTGGLNKHSSVYAYTSADTSSSGVSRIYLGNNTASGTSGAKYGSLRLFGTTTYYTDLVAGAPTDNRVITIVNITGGTDAPSGGQDGDIYIRYS
jgi:hypothetical protein